MTTLKTLQTEKHNAAMTSDPYHKQRTKPRAHILGTTSLKAKDPNLHIVSGKVPLSLNSLNITKRKNSVQTIISFKTHIYSCFIFCLHSGWLQLILCPHTKQSTNTLRIKLCERTTVMWKEPHEVHLQGSPSSGEHSNTHPVLE